MGAYSIIPKSGGAAPVTTPPELIQALIGAEGEPFTGNQDGYLVASVAGNVLGFGLYQSIIQAGASNNRNSDPDGYRWRFATNGVANNQAGVYVTDNGSGGPYPLTLNRVHRMDHDFSAFIKWGLEDNPGLGRTCIGWGFSGTAAVTLDDPGSAFIGLQFSGPAGRGDASLQWMGHNGAAQTVLATTGIVPDALTRYLRLFVKSGGTAATLEILNADGTIALSRPFVLAELPGSTVSLIPTYRRMNIVSDATAYAGRFYYARGCNAV